MKINRKYHINNRYCAFYKNGLFKTLDQKPDLKIKKYFFPQKVHKN